MLLITGGAGFIGGCFVRKLISETTQTVVNLDALTYAGNLDSIPPESDRHIFINGDIKDSDLVQQLLNEYQIETIINFAAESHVDRSIDGPDAFIKTNIDGTFQLLKSSLNYWRDNKKTSDRFRFIHISTDEVYGSLGPEGLFQETTPYAPNSPYSASKAASDHLVRAWYHTFGLPTLITNCSNNYGPFQFPEKLIPLITLSAISGKPLPIYGDGLNVRDWLFVEDHCSAIDLVSRHGIPGQTYNIGGDCERTNLEIVHSICDIVQELIPNLPHHCRDLITYVKDRPGHDRRYAIDATKIKNQLGWQPNTEFKDGLKQTVNWYINNPRWVERVTTGKYQGERLGKC